MNARLHDLVSTSQFQAGLVAGLVAAAVVAPWLLAVARRRAWARDVLAFAFVPAAAYALSNAQHVAPLPTTGLVGVGIVAAAGLVPAVTRLPFWTGTPVAAAGALVLSTTWDTPRWETATLVVMIAVVGPSIVDIDRRWPGVAPVLVVLAVGGLYATLPDTEAARVLVGVVIPMAVFGWPIRAASLGVFGGAFAALCAQVIVTGGVGRQTSVVGAVAALGFLAVEPVASRLKGRLHRRPSVGLPTIVRLLCVDAGVVFACTRVAGMRDEVSVAVGLGVAALLAGALLLPVTPGYR